MYIIVVGIFGCWLLVAYLSYAALCSTEMLVTGSKSCDVSFLANFDSLGIPTLIGLATVITFLYSLRKDIIVSITILAISGALSVMALYISMLSRTGF